MKKILLLVFLLCTLWCQAQTIELVKSFGNYNSFSNMAVLNNKLLLQGKSSEQGAELWVSDGTTAGTSLLVDLVPGTSSGNPRFFKNALGKVLFVGYGEGFVNQLFITDGTAAGTKGLTPLSFSGEVIFSIPRGKEMAGKFYFCSSTPATGNELWVTDGTVAGTRMLKDINPGTGSGNPASFEVMGNMLYFTANNGTNGIELWKSDGTEAGTVLVKDIVAGSGDSRISELRAYKDKIYFGAGVDTELWHSDGTAAGTVLLKNIGGNYSSGPNDFTAFQGKLYFSTEGPSVSHELYETDGTEAGTVLTKDINPGTPAGLPANFYPVNDKLYMTASTVAEGRELRVYIPATNTFSLVKDVTPGTGSGVSISFYPDIGVGIVPNKITHLGSTVIFAATESGFSDTQLWVTDGTPVGSRKVLFPGTTKADAAQHNLTAFNNAVYFYADYTGTNAMSLYKLTTGQALKVAREHEAGFSLYPNPTDGSFKLTVPFQRFGGKMKITTTTGQVVYAMVLKSQITVVPTQSLPAGLYVVTLEQDGKAFSKKLVVQ